ncbi:DUF3566 domain-containing protein [Mycobacterium fragae]|uniref:DUF3566 domain-containing protein n=1 Tax=Mycobacterium fragae TaxID=1260918 RepID=A0A1X1ULX8_9MYCO|nr:DUF3566 domain-containing protein [Mycobacterium fragae]MCV7398590.1 DUF3566 domain-containing protein [Mycobacterium fragae]ORV57855.1 hypothetical protein AWC06_21185 [Mycobacterium fragae]
MTSPNEPGYPGPGDSPNGNGSVDRVGPHRPAADRSSDARDAAPRQRSSGARSPQAPSRPSSEAPPPREPRSPGRPSGAEARVSRFISGTAAPGAAKTPAPGPAKAPPHEADSAPPRHESRHTDAYTSELPDLSGPVPRTAQRKPPPEREKADTSPPTERLGSRVQVSARSRGPVRASMQIRRVDPWSTLKVSLVLSVALFFVWMIAVAFLYLVLGGMGVWSKLNSNVGDLLNNTSGSADLVSSGTIFGGAVLIGLVNIVLLTAMATIGAFIYNLTTDLIGGIEVTLADRD